MSSNSHVAGWFAQATARFQAKDFPAATDLLNRVVAAEPFHPRARFVLGMIAMQTGRPDEAAGHLTAATVADSKFQPPHFLLGLICQQSRRPAEAVAHYRRAIELDPTDVKAANNLGRSLIDLGNLADGNAILQTVLDRDPRNLTALINLGDGLRKIGDRDGAIDICRRAVAVDPNRAEGHGNLAAALADAGRFTEAADGFRRAIALDPKLPSPRYNLAKILLQGRQPDQALELAATAVALRPDFSDAHTLIGECFGLAGRLPEALAAQQKAAAVGTQPSVHSNALLTLNYMPGIDPPTLLLAHRQWAARHAAVLPPPVRPARPAGGKIRIGYLSPNFQAHSVAFFFRPVLAAHDRSRFEIFLYSLTKDPDQTTADFRAMADVWRDVTGQQPATVADQIRSDRIDVLVDLAGHTAGNLLPVFASEPAPVSMTWLGYPATTGMPQIDYRITDDMADPAGAESQSVEKLIRIPGGCWAYAPPPDAPAVSAPPSAANGFVTFGSFNNLPKVTPQVLATWGQIMSRVPRSRLVIKALGLSGKLGRDHVLSHLATAGVTADRVDLLAWTPSTASHLDLYSRVDLALDTFPYNGTTTTCEALWMGVPVLTFPGQSHAGRVGASLLTHAGLDEFVARDREDYIRLAAEEIAPPNRQKLRERFAASPVCDGARLARQLEATFAETFQLKFAGPQGCSL